MGLLPAQAIAHTAITLASCSCPALMASAARVSELAIRHVTPAPNAAKKQPTPAAKERTASCTRPRAANAVAASRSEGVCLDGKTDPKTVPPRERR